MRNVPQYAHSPVAAASPTAFRVPTETIPLALAFFAVSFAFGVLAREQGLSFGLSVLMSALVYAGTSQVVALGMLATSQPVWLIVTVTLLVNSRLMLMGSAFAKTAAGWKRWVRLLFAFQLTDETFALLLNPRDGSEVSPARALWIQAAAHGAWVGGTVLGFLLGGDTSQLHGLGLDYALVAMILAVLVLQIKTRETFAVACFAGAIALLTHYVGLAWFAPLAAAAVAPLLGMRMERHGRA